jgi:hypothetical protein
MSLDLEGGKFLGQGSATCVYKPRIECAPGTIQGIPSDTNYVSRMVPKDEKEFQNQIEVREAIKRLDSKYIGLRFADHFNVAVATCTPVIREEDLQPNQDKKICSLKGFEDLQSVGVKEKYINFITKVQGKNLNEYQNFSIKNTDYAEVKKRFRTAFFELMNATIALNSEGIVHYDLHSNNIAWTTDNFPQKNLVIFDWGFSQNGFDNFIQYLCKEVVNKEGRPDGRPNFKNLLTMYSTYSQYELQLKVLKKIFGVMKNIDKTVKIIETEYSPSKLKTYPTLTSLEKLFYCWDTYSLVNQLLKANYPGLQDLKSNTFFKVRGKSDLNPEKILYSLDALVLQTGFNREGGLQVFVKSLWGLVGFAFNEQPVVRDASTFQYGYKKFLPNEDQNLAANQQFEEVKNALPSRLRLSSSSMHSPPSPVRGAFVDGLSPSPAFNVLKSVGVRSPFASVQGSLYLKQSLTNRNKKSSSRSRKPVSVRSRSKSHSKPVSVRSRSRSHSNPVKSKTCSGNMVLDSRSKSCRERKKPGPKSKSRSTSRSKSKSPCPRNMVRDKISKKCRERKKPGRKPSCPPGRDRKSKSKSKRCVKSKRKF